jgi:hypothetical protein
LPSEVGDQVNPVHTHDSIMGRAGTPVKVKSTPRLRPDGYGGPPK